VTRIAVLDDYQGVAAEYADWGSLNAEVVFFTDHLSAEDSVVARLNEFEIIVAMRERTAFPASLIRKLPKLQLIATAGMRNASIDMAAARQQDVVVCGTAGGSMGATPELTWGLILAVLRHIPLENQSVRAGGWQTSVGGDLAGRTLGILGLGRLGQRLARLGLAFDMNVIAWSANLTQETAAQHGVTRVEKDALFAESDVLSIHTVLSDRTRGLVGAAELASMKPTAILVNTSRGPVVDQNALLKALQDGTIAGAGLDVYDQEPLPAEHPLRSAPRTVLTPHIGFVTGETYRAWYRELVEDVAAFLAGEPVRVLNGSE
jgi:phosphoglycerate dehydrogenase-like enzyme